MILILVALILVLSVLLSLYMVHFIKVSEISLIERQKVRLNQAAYTFDQDFNISLKKYIADNQVNEKSRADKIQIISHYVNDAINDLKTKYPDVHVGLYVADIDVFFDGTERLDENFSLRRKKAFEETIKNKTTYEHNIGYEEEGIVEVYRPLVREDNVEGVIRTAEYLSETEFYNRRRQMENNIYTVMALVIVVGIGGAVFLLRQLVKHVQNIKNGVQLLEYDYNCLLPEAPGELGEITSAINRFARRISDLNLYNETMLSVINDAIMVLDTIGNIIFANNMARKMFQLPAEAVGKNYRKILPEKSPFQLLLDRTLNEQCGFSDVQVSVNDMPGNHNLQVYLLSTFILKDNSGKLIGSVLSCRNITDRVRMEEKMHRQEKLASLGKVVAGVAHEIRNPLTSISCYIQHWQMQNRSDQKGLATVLREISRLDNLVKQLLYFTKPAEAKLRLYNVNSVVEKVLSFLGEVFYGKFNIIKDLSSEIPEVFIDQEQIERVIVNIIFNAVQAMPEGGSISVGTTLTEGSEFVCVWISDTGCGIPPENLPRLFDPFFSTRPNGTGLGLAIAHEIVQAHGGRIELESSSGRGTTVNIYLRTMEDLS